MNFRFSLRTIAPRALFVAASSVALAACIGDAGEPTGDAPPSAEPEAATLSVTEVSVNPDGSPKVVERWITRSEQLSMAAAREAAIAGHAPAAPSGERAGEAAEAWTVDSPCTDPKGLWLYDGPSQTGNQLCLTPDLALSQLATLSSYTRVYQSCFVVSGIPRCVYINGNWSGAVRSYWEPVWSGSPVYYTFAWFNGSGGCQSYFGHAGARAEANTCVQSATSVEAETIQ